MFICKYFWMCTANKICEELNFDSNAVNIDKISRLRNVLRVQKKKNNKLK